MTIKKTALYTRLSREDAKEGISNSIENQITGLLNYANENKLEVYKTYIDDGYTGSNSNRPGFQDLLNDMRTKKINTIIIKDFSRLSRNMYEALELLKFIFPENNMRVISLSDKFDSNKNDIDFNVLIRTYCNEYYYKECLEKAKISTQRRSKIENLSTRGCYGYKRVGKKELAIDDISAEVVKYIFEQYNKNILPSDIAKELTKKKVVSPAYRKYELYNNSYTNIKDKYFWNNSSILKIVCRIEYTGCIVNLKTKTVKGKEIKNNDIIIIDNPKLQIISKEEYIKAQEIRTSRKVKLQTNPNRIKGFFKCSKCNSTFIYEKQNNKTPIYRCKKCSISINTELLHNPILSDIQALINEYIKSPNVLIGRVKTQNINKSQIIEEDKLLKDINKKENELEKLFESYVDGNTKEHEYKDKVAMLNNKLIKLKESLRENNENKLTKEMLEYRVNELSKQLKKATELIDINDLVKAVAKQCIITKTDNKIELDLEYKCNLQIS
ncbi:MAG: recombinase family protein [Mycoplasmatota bacterium]